MRCARRFVLLLAEERDYFFVIYCVYFAAEAWLALLALGHYPAQEHMEALPYDPTLPMYEVTNRGVPESSHFVWSKPPTWRRCRKTPSCRCMGWEALHAEGLLDPLNFARSGPPLAVRQCCRCMRCAVSLGPFIQRVVAGPSQIPAV